MEILLWKQSKGHDLIQGKILMDREAFYFEFAEILNKFVFGEVYNHGKLTDKERILITLCALTAGGIFKNFKHYIKARLNTGLNPEELKKGLYQCTPYQDSKSIKGNMQS